MKLYVWERMDNPEDEMQTVVWRMAIPLGWIYRTRFTHEDDEVLTVNDVFVPDTNHES